MLGQDQVVSGREPMNVPEPWILYDSIIICREMYGSEANVTGWFTSMQAFGQNEKHLFFKGRTEGNAGEAYNNQQVADSLEWPFEIYSWGLSFWAPGTRRLGTTDGRVGLLVGTESQLSHFWESDFPRNCAIQLKINQDIVAESTSLVVPPGYGPSGGGGVYPGVDNQPLVLPQYIGHLNYGATQGVPGWWNRFQFEKPIEVQKDAIIEGILTVSEWARDALKQWAGPAGYLFPTYEGTVDTFNNPAARFGITLSLMGRRLVQQRGQYFR